MSRLAGVLFKRPHSSDCRMRGDEHCWVIDHRRPYYRGATTMWLRWRCNDPQCTGLVLVDAWALSGQIKEALR
jgi:hypothetical protein